MAWAGVCARSTVVDLNVQPLSADAAIARAMMPVLTEQSSSAGRRAPEARHRIAGSEQWRNAQTADAVPRKGCAIRLRESETAPSVRRLRLRLGHRPGD